MKFFAPYDYMALVKIICKNDLKLPFILKDQCCCSQLTEWCSHKHWHLTQVCSTSSWYQKPASVTGTGGPRHTLRTWSCFPQMTCVGTLILSMFWWRQYLDSSLMSSKSTFQKRKPKWVHAGLFLWAPSHSMGTVIKSKPPHSLFRGSRKQTRKCKS